jgi:hypothetical protein
MQFTTRAVDPTQPFPLQVRPELLTRFVPATAIDAVFAELGLRTHRIRKLTLQLLVWLVIAMNLFATVAIEDALEQLLHGLRLLWPDDDEYLGVMPQKSAITYRRYQLGVRPLRRLFHRVCRPLATSETRGAFLGGLRLMAIDGHLQDVPDTPANATVFGRPRTERGDSAFPQVLCVSLVECGTHALVDTSFWPCHAGEHRGARRLLRSLTAEMLVLVDRGIYSYDLVCGVRQRGAQLLARIAASVQPEWLRRLPDGSSLVQIHPGKQSPRRHGQPQLVRLIEYTLADPQLPGHGQVHRLVTTLLDPEEFPALMLVCAYHERWEFELVVDEQDTHQLQQHHPSSPLRSRKPAGVIQELYGLMLAHYVVRALMHEAALLAEEDPDRLSFVHALRVIQEAVPDFEIAAPALLEGLFRRLLRELARTHLPERKPRAEPRCVRRKVIKWPLKRSEHYRWPQPTRAFEKAVALI